MVPVAAGVPAAQAQMFQMITGYWATQIVGTLAKLGIPDAIAAGHHSSVALAQALALDEDALFRVLRAASALGVLRQTATRTFELTELGETLQAHACGSLRDMAIAQASAGHWLPWGSLEQAVREGQRVAPSVLGGEIWDWYATHPSEGAAFSTAMANVSALVASSLVAQIDFTDDHVVDVGGAHGLLLRLLLAHHPSSRGILFDLPHVIAQVTADSAFTVVAGDFRQQVPAARTYVLKHILHDWDDATAIGILRNCAAAGGKGSRTLVIEVVIPDDGRASQAQLMDVHMLVMLPGRERSLAEYKSLMHQAGLGFERAVPLPGGFWVLEAFAQ